jgi:GDP-L-fucose synthase
MELGRQHGLRWLYLVPSTVYGPGYHTDGRDLHFVYDLARKIVRGKRFGDDVVLWGDGSQRRELVHVDEVVHAVTALPEVAQGEVVNLGAGEDHSISEIASLLCEIADYPIEQVRFDPDRFVGARDKVLSTTRLDMLLPDRPRVPLRDGLAQVVTWVEANLDVLE